MANTLQYAHGENVSDTAPNSIGSGDTSITVNTISKWNSNGGPIVINRGASDQEYVIASGVSGSSITISQRGAYGSSAVAHNANATLESVPFATQWNNMLTALLNLFKVADGNIDITKLFGTNYVADSGSANAYAATLSPVLASYATGVMVAFKATNANTTASTLNVNGLGTKTIKIWKGSTIADLTANDILAGQLVVVVYDGTYFQMVSPSGSAVTLTDTQTLSNKTLASPTATGTSTVPTMQGTSSHTQFPAVIGEYNNGSQKGTYNIDWTKGDRQLVTCDHTGNLTLTYSGGVQGQTLTLRIIEDSTGGSTITLPTTKWPGGSAGTFTTTANAINLLIVYYDGTNYLTQLAAGFA